MTTAIWTRPWLICRPNGMNALSFIGDNARTKRDRDGMPPVGSPKLSPDRIRVGAYCARSNPQHPRDLFRRIPLRDAGQNFQLAWGKHFDFSYGAKFGGRSRIHLEWEHSRDGSGIFTRAGALTPFLFGTGRERRQFGLLVGEQTKNCLPQRFIGLSGQLRAKVLDIASGDELLHGGFLASPGGSTRERFRTLTCDRG